MPAKKATTRTSVTDLDLFGAAPRFNIGGKKRVGSICGFIVTLAIVCIMLIYGVPKLINVITKADIKVSNQVLNGKYDASTVFNTKKNNFRIAFGSFGYYGAKSILDPKYVGWQITLKSSKQG
jgi:nitrogen fixation protein FixH